MKKRLWRLISIMLIFVMGVAGPLGQMSYGVAYDALGTFNFDLGTSPYIEFNNTSPSAIDIGQATSLKFALEGSTDSSVVNGDVDNRVQNFIETFAVMLTDQYANGEVSIAKASGNLVNSNETSVLEIVLEFSQNALHNDTPYRIDFLTPTVRALINRVAQNVYTDTVYDNVRFETANDIEVLSQNMARYGTTTPPAITVREFTGDNVLTISGPELSMNLGDITGFGVEQLSFMVEGNGQLGNQPTSISAALNGVNSLTGDFYERNSAPYVYEINVPSLGTLSGATTVSIELDTASMQSYSSLIQQYINDNPSDGNVYVLGKDGSGNVVAYNLLTSTNAQLYVDPEFMFEGTTQPPFVGFYDTGAQPVLKYVYTGIPDTQSSGMTIDGVSSYDLNDGAGPQQTPFTLDLYEYQDADYMQDTMWFKELDGEIMNPGSEVPVNIFEDNTITLSHDNQEVAVDQRPITTTFHWMPSASVVESFFEFAYIEEYRIGSQSDIHVITEPYSGDISDLYLEIVELDLTTVIDGEPAQSKLERYEARYVESITEDQSGKDKSRITFERVDADYMGLDSAMNTYDLRANLVFDNTALTSLGAIETLLDGTLEADFNPPEPYNFEFEGVMDGIYYFIIGLNDQVNVSQLSANKDLFLDLFNKTADVSGVNIVSVEGYQDPYGGMTTPIGDTYNMIRVGVDTLLPPRTELIFKGTVENNGSADLNIEFDSATDELIITGEFAGNGELVFHVVDSGGVDQYITKTYQAASTQTDFGVDYFFESAFDAYPTRISADGLLAGSEFFAGIADVNGNALFEAEYVELFMETQINSVLMDADGNYILNADISLIPVSDIPEPTSGSAITWDHVYNLMSDGDGMVNGSVYPGTYLAFELSEKDADGVKEERSIDMNIAFPVRSSNDPYTDPIQLPENNVTGNSIRSDSASAYEEDIIFIETQYLDELQIAMNDMSNWELFDVLDMFYIKEVTTDSDGTFSAYLSAGNYTLIGKFEGDSIVRPLSVNGTAVSEGSPYTFTVDTSGAVIPNVEFPPPTVTGLVTNNSGLPLSEVYVELKGSGGYYETLTDENGVFNLAVNVAGDYVLAVVRSDWDSEGSGQLFVNKMGFANLSISDSEITQISAGDLAQVDMGTIQMPMPKMTVQFQVDGSDVGVDAYSGILITQEAVAEEEPFDFHVNSRTGGFDLYLPDGDYTIEEFNFNDMWVELKTPLSFNIPSSSSPYYIELNDYYNAVIKVLDESGQPLQGYRIEAENEFSWMYQNAVTNAAGDAFFNFEVPDDGSDAMVRIVGYEYKDKWYDLYEQNLMLNVNETHGGTNKAALTITVQKPNFTGEVYYTYPDQKITNGHLDIRWKSDPGTMMDEWYNVWINESGSFTFVLPKVGTYVIESAGANYGDMETSWFEINKSVEVIDDGSGKLLVVEPGTTTPVTMPMTITKAQPNFTGHLYKTGTTPYLASVDTTEFYVAMVVQQTGVDPILLEYEPWNYEYRINVNQAGYFEANLDPSNSYQVVGVETSRGWFEFSTPVAVVLSDALSTITAPTPNVNGIIAEFDGTPITGINYGRVEVEKSDGTEWMGADIDETGSFGIALENGADYVIREYWYDTETTPGVFTNHYVRLDRKITVGSNSDQMTLGPNFMIDLSASSDLMGIPSAGTQAYDDFMMYDNYFNANVRPVLTATDFDTDAKYQDYLNNPWNYGLWLEGKYNQSTGNIEFYTYLDNGSYELMDVNGMYLNLEIGQKFTINGASSTGVTYASSPDRYTMDVAYETNVTGTILESGQAVPYAWVNFMRTDVAWDDYTTSMWYGTKTNANGEFALNLPSDEQTGPDGDDETTADYRLDGYNTEGFWEGYQWVPGKWTPIGYRFQINSQGVLTDTSGTELSEISIVPNVTGKVYKFFKDYDTASDFIEATPSIGDQVQAKQAWLTIWPYDKADPNYEIPWEDWDKSIWTETNMDTGVFSLMLEPGDYIVTDASMNNFWFNPETVFTVDSNGSLVDEAGDAVENGILVVKPETPNFSGVAYTDSSKNTPLKWGWMMARPDDADDEDWESYAWINTDQSGYFEMKLADGAWTIEEMGNYNTWTRVNIPFSVSGSTVTSSVSGLVSGGQVFVYPPEPNLQGYLENKSGAQVYANAWLTIKPADASEYEWEDAIWTEYALQSDGVTYRFKENIKPGDYKVVEVGGYDFFYQTDVRFTVNADGSIDSSNLEGDLLVVAPPQPNLTGQVYGDTDSDGEADDLVGNGWIGIARFENGVQVTMEGEAIPSGEYKDEWSNMYWQYTRWTETNANGKYEMKLSAGTYRIIGVSGQGVWYEPRKDFTIVAGELKLLDITEPGPNVTITVSGVPTEMQGANYAWLDVFSEVDGMKYFEPFEFKSSSGSEFIFEGNLSQGNYTVGFFGTEYGGIEIDDTGLSVDGAQTTYTVNVGNESGKQVVTGQILMSGNALGQKAWIKIEGTVDAQTVTKKTQTDGSGNFKFKLPENTDWSVTEISLKEGYLLLPESTSYDFNAGSDTSPSEDWDLDIGSLLQ